MTVTVLYFAWLRERIGQGREEVETEAETLRALAQELAARDDWHAQALSDLSAIRCARDQELVDWDAPLRGAREVAFFPPMTGG